MEILIGLFIIGVIIVLYNIFTTDIPEECYLVSPRVKSTEKPVEEYFENTLETDDFVKKEKVIEVIEPIEIISKIKAPKKHLQKRERKTLKHIVKDK